MRIARRPGAVWTMLLLPPVTLAALVVGYLAWAGTVAHALYNFCVLLT